ncbi:hypothetical protein L6R52_40760 [Myxococcota bacterium]|nr:hypothetical protein [Myxococcota bacterium]
MRVSSFRAWFSAALQQGVGAARRAGLAVTRSIRRATGQIEISAGVGDDESRFGQTGSRAWLELLDDAREKLIQLFEKSTFERFPRFERFVRRVLGRSARLEHHAPSLPAPKPKGPTGPLGAHTPKRTDDERLRAQVRVGMMQAHTGERAGIRDRIETQRHGDDDRDGDRDGE